MEPEIFFRAPGPPPQGDEDYSATELKGTMKKSKF
jgi:hypothetical protein